MPAGHSQSANLAPVTLPPVPHAIVTMTRGDAQRIEEWIVYHSRLGFDDFQIILDGECDDTAAVLNALDLPITIHRRDEIGEYADGLSVGERRLQTIEWRARHHEDLVARRIRGHDPLSWRQQLHFPAVLEPYASGARGKGWLSLLDVDEFLVLPGYSSIREVTHRPGSPRLRFLSFDVDTTDHDPSRPVLEQHFKRWSYDDLLSLDDQRWVKRVKSLVRFSRAQLSASVHKISWGRHRMLDPDLARLHHFRVPNQGGVHLSYSVEDPVRMPSDRR